MGVGPAGGSIIRGMDDHASASETHQPPVRSSELLDFPPDARVLIINCDDFGMYHAVNAAVIRSIEEGIAKSCSLMVPCPWALHALQLLRERPEIPFGIHLTLLIDVPHYRWRPLTAREKVPSLLDGTGELFRWDGMTELLARARLDEVELEFRAQIDAVVDAGLAPTHLDFHSLADGGRADILDLTVELAQEYGLAVRIWLELRRAYRRPTDLFPATPVLSQLVSQKLRSTWFRVCLLGDTLVESPAGRDNVPVGAPPTDLWSPKFARGAGLFPQAFRVDALSSARIRRPPLAAASVTASAKRPGSAP
jgi:predicted glycoside hydrolase/deacetylase ChbG (UPF0249 family)